VAAGATLAGGVLMLLFQGVGARIPQDVADPLVDLVWPLWTGLDPLPRWWTGARFARNLAGLALPLVAGRLLPAWQWLQFAPLVVFQAVGLAYLFAIEDDPPPAPPGVRPRPVRPAY
jgi:hypothetical protein